MPDVGISPYDAAFAALQVLAVWSGLHIRRFGKLLLLITAFALIGWGLLLGAEFGFDSQMAAYFETLPQPLNDQQIAVYDTDEASKGIAAIFGLPIAWVVTSLSVALGKLTQRMWLAFMRATAAY